MDVDRYYIFLVGITYMSTDKLKSRESINKDKRFYDLV